MKHWTLHPHKFWHVYIIGVTLNLFMNYGRIDTLPLLTFQSINAVDLYVIEVFSDLSQQCCVVSRTKILYVFGILKYVSISWFFLHAFLNSTDFNNNSQLFLASINLTFVWIRASVNRAPLLYDTPHSKFQPSRLPKFWSLFPQLRGLPQPAWIPAVCTMFRRFFPSRRLHHCRPCLFPLSCLMGYSLVVSWSTNEEYYRIYFVPSYKYGKLAYTNYSIMAASRWSSHSLFN